MSRYKIKENIRIKRLSLLAIILTICPWFSACAIHRLPPKPPIILPFAVEQAGNKVETEVRIVKEQSYSLSLYFMHRENDQEDIARVRKLTGSAKKNREGRALEPGIPIPLRVKISVIESEEERLIVDTELSEHRLESWGKNRLGKVITKLILKPGRYRVSIETLKDIPALKGTHINFAIVRTHTGK